MAVDSGFLRIDARSNLTALGNAIEQNVASIQGSTTLSQADKDRLSAEWKKLETDLQNSNNLSLAAEVVPAALLAAAGGLAAAGITSVVVRLGTAGVATVTAITNRFGPEIANRFVEFVDDPIEMISISNGDFSGLLPLDRIGDFGKLVSENPVVRQFIDSEGVKAVTRKVDELKIYLGELDFKSKFDNLGSKLDDLMRGNHKLTSKEFDLAFDPAQREINFDELRQALEAERQLGIELRRSPVRYDAQGNPQRGPDFVDPRTGKTYDGFETGPSNFFDAQFNSGAWQQRLVQHLDKSDITLLDLSRLSPEQKIKALEFAQNFQGNNKLIILN